jgi:hypothetical protein
MRYLTSFHFESIVVADKVISLSTKSTEAWLTLQAGDIRYRYDGVAPTPLEGHILHANNSLRLHGEEQVSRFKAIAITDAAILSVSYERE